MEATSLGSPPSDLHVQLSVVTTLDMTNDVSTSDYSSTLPPPLLIPCDNPWNVVSPSVAEVVDLLVYVGIFPVLVTSGIITNVINMAVFARQGLSNRIHVCLFSLAGSDTGCLLFVMCSKSYALLGLLEPAAGRFWQQRHNGLVLGLYLAFLAISNTVTTIIALERCLCVLSPLKAARVFRTKYMVALIVVVAVYILVVKYTGVNLKYQTIQVTDPLSNTSTFINRLSPFYLRHRTLIDIIYLYLVSVALPFISLLVVIICTTVIIFRLKVNATWRRRSVSNVTSVEKQEVSMTRMLVTVCCVYVVCMTPSVSRVLLFSRLPGFLSTGYMCNVYRVATAFTLLLEALNSSVNFLIYVTQSSQYRATLRRVFSRGGAGTKESLRHTQHPLQRQKQSLKA